MQKRVFSFLLCLVLLFSLIGCRKDSPRQTTDPSQSSATSQTEPSTESSPLNTNPSLPEETTPPTTEPPVAEGTVLWTPICNEFINLRSTPDSPSVLAQVPVGAALTLLEWSGKYALVRYGNIQGYVASNYLKPVDEDYFAKRLQVVVPTGQYTYEQMWADMSALQTKYPQLVTVSSIGYSEEYRKIPVLQIGDPNAPRHVLMQGAMHGREYMTAWILMALADYALSQGQLSDGAVCYHIIPMSNPDGVVISQSKALNETQQSIYQNDLALGYTNASASDYAEQWKANALGIDLNRNFASGWEVSLEHISPSSEKFRGSAPFSATEAIALRDYTLKHNFSTTISVHSHGSVIYYQYGKKQPVNDLSYALASAVAEVTGYTPMVGDGTTGAGYKDWAMDALEIPSLTLETGTWYTPMPEQELYNTFARWENLIPAINQWLAYTE